MVRNINLSRPGLPLSRKNILSSMSSLANKEEQKQANGKGKSQSSQKGVITAASKKALTKRSVSFEKFLVTAFHIRLACTKCSRESLKFCLEMLISRSQIITDHSIAMFNLLVAHLVQLSHELNSTFLEIAGVVIPKWQIRARHILEATVLLRHWRRQKEEQKQQQEIEIKGAVDGRKKKDESQETVKKAAEVKRDVIVEEAEEEEVVGSEVESETLERFSAAAVDKAFAGVTGVAVVSPDEEQTMRQRLTIAVAACVIFLALQLCLGVALLFQSVQGMPLGLVFLVACIVYIAYLLQSICEFTRLNMTTCKYGKSSKQMIPRRVVNPVEAPVETGTEGAATTRRTRTPVKLVQLSFLEKTMSKVKLL